MYWKRGVAPWANCSTRRSVVHAWCSPTRSTSGTFEPQEPAPEGRGLPSGIADLLALRADPGQLRGGHARPASPARILPRRQDAAPADRQRAAVHGRGLSRRHRRLRGLQKSDSKTVANVAKLTRVVRTRHPGAGQRPGDPGGSSHPPGRPAGCRADCAGLHHAARTDQPPTVNAGTVIAVGARAGPDRGHQRRVPAASCTSWADPMRGRRTPCRKRDELQAATRWTSRPFREARPGARTDRYDARRPSV